MAKQEKYKPKKFLSIFWCLSPPGGSVVQCRRCRRHRFNPWVRKIPLEEGMATHSSILAWRIPWTEEPGGLWFTGSQRVGQD